MDLSRSCLILTQGTINAGLLTGLIVLLIFSAFFSATEIAYSSANSVRLKVYAEEGKKGAGLALNMTEHFDNVLTTILIGNNIVNIAMAIFFTSFFQEWGIFGDYLEVGSIAATTLIVLTFGEILPKSIAKRYADSFAIKFSTIVRFFIIILKPLSIVFLAIQKALSKSDKAEEPSVTEGELEAILDTMTDEGVILNDEAELIQSVLDLNDKNVEDIMRPRIDVVAVSVFDDVEKIKKVFFDNQYSRIPVYADDKDNIIGVLYERDFFTKLIKKQKINIKTLAKKAHYVPKSMKVDALIHELQKLKVHMAIVSGEYGETAGIVTMEDALEELVGEIYDEHDEGAVDLITKIAEDEYIVDANTELEELFDWLGITKEPDDKYLKVANWIYSQAEVIPEEGFEADYRVEYISRDDDNDKYVERTKVLHFYINEVEDRRIKNVRIVVEDCDNSENEE